MINSELIRDGLPLIKRINKHSPIEKGESVICQRIDSQNSKLTAHLIMERQAITAVDDEMQQLLPKIQSSFDKSELRQLCFNLNVDFEELKGDNHSSKILSLITYMKRRERLSDLVERCASLRPDTNWELDEEVVIVPKLETAVVVDIARPAVQKVAKYLDDQGLNANFLVFNNEEGGFFKISDDWEQLTITFSDVMDKIKRKFPDTRIHFFMAGPGVLLFAMGCVWGTVDNAIVYHYDNGGTNTYYPMLETTRKLRQTTSR